MPVRISTFLLSNKQSRSIQVHYAEVGKTGMSELSKDIKSLENSFIISVLKYATDEEHPLSAAEITARMQNLTTEFHDAKTVLRKLRSMCDVSEGTGEDEVPARAFALTYGGYVRSVSTTVSGNTKNPKPQFKFYFEPFLMQSDISMIYGSLASSRYLSAQAKDYLLSTLQVLTPGQRIEEKEIQHYLPEEPVRRMSKKSRAKYIDLLHTVKVLYDAIRQKKRVEVVYGSYTYEKQREISFVEKNAEKPYVLNPYAMFWNNGLYYLLATHWNYTNPVFFRVDRIVSAEYYVNEEKPEREKRAPIPCNLRKYYKRLGTKEEYFDFEQYTAVHPLMAISQEENLIECCLECNNTTLGLLVDTFGSIEILGEEIQILDSKLNHAEIEAGQTKEEALHYFTVRIPQVQYENIRAFCVQNHHLITVISPANLTLEVLRIVSNSMLKYAKVLNLQTMDEEGINPFLSSNDHFLAFLQSFAD